MTAKEKARELYDKFYNSGCMDDYAGISECAKECALIAVDEILNALSSERISYGGEYRYEESDFWQQIKNEIEKL